MDDILAALDDQQVELHELITPIDEAAWAKPSRCDGWSNADVLLHLAQTNEMAIGSLTDRFDEVLISLTEGLPPGQNVDDGAALMVEHQRGGSAQDVYDRWKASVDTMMEAYWDADSHKRVQWVAGTLSVHTLATTRLAETWIHTNDISYGMGVDLPAPSRLIYISRLAWRTLPYAFMRAGRELTASVEFDLLGTNGQPWVFTPDEPATTFVRGPAAELCAVAAQRAHAGDTSLTAEGPQADEVLELVRTFA